MYHWTAQRYGLFLEPFLIWKRGHTRSMHAYGRRPLADVAITIPGMVMAIVVLIAHRAPYYPAALALQGAADKTRLNMSLQKQIENHDRYNDECQRCQYQVPL